MNKRHYEHTLPNIRGSLSNTYNQARRPTFASDKTRAVRDGKAGREKQAARAATKGKECNYKRKRAVAGYPGG